MTVDLLLGGRWAEDRCPESSAPPPRQERRKRQDKERTILFSPPKDGEGISSETLNWSEAYGCPAPIRYSADDLRGVLAAGKAVFIVLMYGVGCGGQRDLTQGHSANKPHVSS